jgi:hypothetical protein
MNIDKTKKHLCININTKVFSFGALANNSIINFKSYNLSSEWDYIWDNEEFKKAYDYITVSFESGRNTLIPYEFFNPSEAKSIFKLNYEPKKAFNIDYNRLAELNTTNIFEIDSAIKRKLVLKIPKANIYHSSSILIRKIIASKDNFFLKASIYLMESRFILAIVEKGNLIYFNDFEHRTLEDLLYHVSFVFNQKEINPSEIKIEIKGKSIEKEFEQFKNYFPEVSILENHVEGQDDILLNHDICV